jgi:hypothetical protein
MTDDVLCHRCGEALDQDAPAVRAYGRVVVAPASEEIPDLRGSAAVFHQACAPAWGDPDWISRAEGPLDELTGQP